MRTPGSVAAGLSFALSALAPVPAPAAVVPDGFAAQHVVTGPFGGPPIAFSWLPDGRIVLVTRNGIVRLAPSGGAASAEIHVIPDVTTFGERGLTGVAVDPAWPARPYLYFYYTHVDSVAHLAMLTASGDLTDPASTNVTLADPYLLIDDVPDVTEIHNGGTVRFGPDGMLYLSLGEDEAACEAQNRESLLGAVLRLDVSSMPGLGPGPPPKAEITPAGNPFPGPNENERLTWAWGLRNPFRFTIDSMTGDLWVGDVGADAWEEIDRIETSTPGPNFGWPRREGPDAYDPGDSCGVGNVFAEPAYSHAHIMFPQSIVAGPRYRGAAKSAFAFPSLYEGSVFYAEFFGGWIRRLDFDGESWAPALPVPGQAGDDWASGLGSPVDLQEGPDGALWYMHMNLFPTRSVPEEGIYRIVPTSPTGADGPATGAASPLRASPNPLGRARDLSIRWDTARTGHVRLRVVDVTGRAVRTLVDAVRPGGAGSVTWNGRDGSDRPVPAGVYFIRLEAGSVRATQKISITR